MEDWNVKHTKLNPEGAHRHTFIQDCPRTGSISVFGFILLLLTTFMFLTSCGKDKGQWSEDGIWEWYDARPWMLGSNFIPSSAINQIEMWQKSSWDPETIDRELGYAEELGMNSMRVFLNYLVWKEEGEAFLERIDTFLDLTEKHGMSVLFVLLDDCWDPEPHYGKQKEPVPYIHNSGWVQCPGWEILSDTGSHGVLEPYVKEVLQRFDGDPRVMGWDLYNEPGNMNKISYADPDNKPEFSLILLKKVFNWAREVHPSQPLTTGVWTGDWSDPDSLSALNKYSLESSDFISFHCYLDLEGFQRFHAPLKRYNRPIACTEWMSRGFNGTFQQILPYLKKEKVAGYNWGLVGGKSQTYYTWQSWLRDISGEEEFWDFDLLRPDGSGYDPDEPRLIREMMNE